MTDVYLLLLCKHLNRLLKAALDENTGGEVSFWYAPMPHFLTQYGILGEGRRPRNYSKNYKWFGEDMAWRRSNKANPSLLDPT